MVKNAPKIKREKFSDHEVLTGSPISQRAPLGNGCKSKIHKDKQACFGLFPGVEYIRTSSLLILVDRLKNITKSAQVDFSSEIIILGPGRPSAGRA